MIVLAFYKILFILFLVRSSNISFTFNCTNPYEKWNRRDLDSDRITPLVLFIYFFRLKNIMSMGHRVSEAYES